MFLCDACYIKETGVKPPISFDKSYGICEKCGKEDSCTDYVGYKKKQRHIHSSEKMSEDLYNYICPHCGEGKLHPDKIAWSYIQFYCHKCKSYCQVQFDIKNIRYSDLQGSKKLKKWRKCKSCGKEFIR